MSVLRVSKVSVSPVKKGLGCFLSIYLLVGYYLVMYGISIDDSSYSDVYYDR
jgi:hypothetical protein